MSAPPAPPAPVEAGGRTLEVEARPCATQVRVRADGVPLGQVVKALTDALNIRLEARAQLTEPVTYSGSGTPEQVLRQLMRDGNLILDTQPSARCAGERLATVWLLPVGQVAPPRGAPSVQVQQPGEATFKALRPPRPQGTRKRMTDEEWQKAKADYKAGKTQADPDTGLPVPVKPAPEQ